MIKALMRLDGAGSRLRGLVCSLLLFSLFLPGCPKEEIIRRLDKDALMSREPGLDARVEAMTRFGYAHQLAMEGRNEQAIEELYLAIRKDPDSAYLREVLAYLLLQERRLDEAESWVRESLEIEPDRADSYYLLGLILIEKGNLEGAETALARAVELDPDDSGYVIELADVQLRQDRSPDALRTLTSYSSLHPEDLLIGFYIGVVLEQDGNISQAAEQYESVLRIDPSFYPALHDLFRLELGRGNLERATEVGFALVEFYPGDSESRILLARAMVASGREDEALTVLEVGKSAGMLDPVWWLEKGSIYLDQGNLAAAREELESALALDPDNETAVFGLGLIEYQAKNYGEADTYFEIIQSNSELYVNAQRMLILSAFATGKEDRAVQLAKQLYQKRPNNQAAVLVYAMAMRETGNYDAAVKALTSAQKKWPREVDVWLGLAIVQSQYGEPFKAIATMEKFLEKDPGNPAALNFIGYTLAEQGARLDEAEAMVRQALDASPGSGYIMDSLGWIYYQRGDYQTALEWLLKAHDAEGPNSEILEHIGDVHLATGNTAKAHDYYEQALDEAPSERARQKIRRKLEALR